MTRLLLLLSACLLVLGACGAKPAAAKRYPIQGVVKALDAAAKTATIQHGRIGDWMEAMTMEFPVKPDAEYAKLHVGDRIDGIVVVEDVKYYVTDVKVTGRAQ
jgi:Cu/Ag efflux protein CusF